ncbi:hypothetical protein [Lysobacter sp. Root604]|uniref:hypothetical protein n=1 Tax=Lysobacter sp. Root604 TaxID=1736568 RepID=UPI0006F59D30|nr:hypothetical protein [Lysobacter sp. Root604]KRA20554.1 hypothetical protein ASD69_04300 [Lysobacter sp. Root604]
MRPIRSAVALTLCVAATTAANAHARGRYLELVNRAHDSVVAVAIADVGQSAFRDAALGESLRGGGGSATIELDGEACRRDFRVAFRDGRSQLYRDIDVCRRQRLQLRPFPREREAGAMARE